MSTCGLCVLKSSVKLPRIVSTRTLAIKPRVPQRCAIWHLSLSTHTPHHMRQPPGPSPQRVCVITKFAKAISYIEQTQYYVFIYVLSTRHSPLSQARTMIVDVFLANQQRTALCYSAAATGTRRKALVW